MSEDLFGRFFDVDGDGDTSTSELFIASELLDDHDDDGIDLDEDDDADTY